MATLTPEEFAAAIAKAPSAFLSHFDTRMRQYLRSFTQGTMAKQIAGRPGLYSRTGALRRSFGFAVTGEQSIETWTGTVYTTSPYASLHEKGGTAVPRRSRFLTIPLGAARTGGGVTRGGARSFPNTFFAKSKAGNLLLFQRQGKKVVPLFVLKMSVTIPPRLGFESAWERERPDRISVIRRSAKEALDGLKAS